MNNQEAEELKKFISEIAPNFSKKQMVELASTLRRIAKVKTQEEFDGIMSKLSEETQGIVTQLLFYRKKQLESQN
jgi:hypothetical protein